MGKKRIVVLLFGTEERLQAIIDAIKSKELDITIEIVISDKEYSSLEIVRNEEGIEVWTIPDARSFEEFNERLYSILNMNKFDFILLDGSLGLLGKKIQDTYKILQVSLYPVLMSTPSFEPSLTKHLNIGIWKAPVIIRETDTLKDIARRLKDEDEKQLISVLKKLSQGKIDF